MKTILMLICAGVMFASCGNGSGEVPVTENAETPATSENASAENSEAPHKVYEATGFIKGDTIYTFTHLSNK